MSSGFRAVITVLALVGVGVYSSAAPVYQQVEAVEVRPRDGIGNVMTKIKRGESVTVAYLGGSITAMNGWRNKTTEWLKATWPEATFKEVHAAIGGTGSDLGVFRLRRDVLEQKPDLLFVEFATNDGGTAPEAIWRSMEGIVRQTWRVDARTDIVFTYTITEAVTNDYCKGMCSRAASAMELLADHYGIPSINFGPRVVELVKADKILMSDAAFESSVPKDTPERDKVIKERMAAAGRLLFANDGVHPGDEGHELYKLSVVAGFERMRDMLAIDHAGKLATCFVEDNWEAAKMVPITAAMLTGEWHKLPDNDSKQRSFGGRMGQIWLCEKPGGKLSFRFKGTLAKIYDLLGPDGGQVTISVDGKSDAKPVPRFDSYCTYHRIATLGVVADAASDSAHEVVVELHPEQPDRQSVAFRLKDPDTELKSTKYQGTRFWCSQLMLIGDLVE